VIQRISVLCSLTKDFFLNMTMVSIPSFKWLFTIHAEKNKKNFSASFVVVQVGDMAVANLHCYVFCA
jgi:hypothetical protein